MRKRYGILAAAAATVAVAGGATAAIADIDVYADSLVPGYETVRLISTGDTIPETSDPANRQYRIVGIPDGLGATAGPRGTRIVYMNHELTSATQSEPNVDGALNRGAFVSKLVLNRRGDVVSGERAYDTVYIDDTLIGPAAEVGNATRAFSRFCSGSLAGRAEGFDRPIYFANEEDSGTASTFDGRGGLSVAIFDNEAHALTDLGHFAWENTLVQRGTGRYTVIMGMEDGPNALAATDAAGQPVDNSQLWMYVGVKDRSPGATVLERNGLVGGTLHVFVGPSGVASEADFTSGRITGRWVAIPNAGDLTTPQLEAAADAVGAMRFARPEDGAFNLRDSRQFFWVTTGGAAGANVLGRVYSLDLNRRTPNGPASLSIEVNADEVVAAGGDTALSPDNIDVSGRYLMVQEDGTTESRVVMGQKGRDGSIWRFDITRRGIDGANPDRVVQLSPPGRDGVAVGPGVWETSGIIDTSSLFGEGSWLFDVQAHGPTTAPVPNTVEDGQLVLLTRVTDGDDRDDDDRDDD